MTTLTVTARGQVTFRKDLLRHLGIQPGKKIELDLLPDGRGMLKRASFWLCCVQDSAPKMEFRPSWANPSIALPYDTL